MQLQVNTTLVAILGLEATLEDLWYQIIAEEMRSREWDQMVRLERLLQREQGMRRQLDENLNGGFENRKFILHYK